VESFGSTSRAAIERLSGDEDVINVPSAASVGAPSRSSPPSTPGNSHCSNGRRNRILQLLSEGFGCGRNQNEPLPRSQSLPCPPLLVTRRYDMRAEQGNMALMRAYQGGQKVRAPASLLAQRKYDRPESRWCNSPDSSGAELEATTGLWVSLGRNKHMQRKETQRTLNTRRRPLARYHTHFIPTRLQAYPRFKCPSPPCRCQTAFP
jgi:hypothetical protein